MFKKSQCVKCDKKYTTSYLVFLGINEVKRTLCPKCRKEIKKNIVVKHTKKII